MESIRILYIVPHRKNRSPGQRFRCEHFLPHLQEAGYTITYAPLLSEWDDKHFYKKSSHLQKLFILGKSFCKRMLHCWQARHYDIIFIYREAFMVGTTLFERCLSVWKKPIVYDFDDSIWLNDISEGNKHLRWLKNTKKTNTIISLSSVVIVGNSFLQAHALHYNSHVEIIPTTIDTAYHRRTAHANSTPIRVGWTGTETTHKHLLTILPVLHKVKLTFGNAVQFVYISNKKCDALDAIAEFIPWNLESEISDLESFNIGIMPLPNDEWSKGKCGFKGLQYMALEIAPILSPVGVNVDIIKHGENGFLAESFEEWESYLSLLITDASLRKSIGTQARKRIEESYSIHAHKARYIHIFDSLLKK